MILATTAGTVGPEASRLLGQRRVPVGVIVGNAEKAAALLTEGVDVSKGALEVPPASTRRWRACRVDVVQEPRRGPRARNREPTL